MAQKTGTGKDTQFCARRRQGDSQALGEAFGRHRERLRRMVQLRMDRRLQGRSYTANRLRYFANSQSRRLSIYPVTVQVFRTGSPQSTSASKGDSESTVCAIEPDSFAPGGPPMTIPGVQVMNYG